MKSVKLISLAIAMLFCAVSLAQNSNLKVQAKQKPYDDKSIKLNGTYKVEFNNNSNQKDGYMTFNDSVFTMRNNHFLPYNGKVEYYKTLTSISSEHESNIIIDFRTNEIGKDTINFQVHDKDIVKMSYLDISVNSGKMIKIKYEETKLDDILKNGSPNYVPIRIGRPGANDNPPLYILDGKFINDKEFQKLKPENIESVKVLKDSAATALYGSRGIKGVIIITTKKLSKRELIKLKKKDS